MLKNQRGAALLLAIYFCSTTLLLMGMLSLQRTNQAMRAAQLSRDLDQAFWLAEGALDTGLARFRTETLIDGVPYAVTTPSGTASFTLNTSEAEILPAGGGPGGFRERVLHRLTASATSANGLPATLSTYLLEERTLEGAWGNGVVVAHTGTVYTGETAQNVLAGNLRSNLGVLSSTIDGGRRGFFGYQRHDLNGLAQTKDLAALEGAFSDEMVSITNGYRFMNRVNSVTDTGISYLDEPGQGAIARVTGEAAVGVPGKPLPRASIPREIPPSACAQDLVLKNTSAWTRITEDIGQDGVRDLIPGDGRITLCVNAIVPANESLWLDSMAKEPPVVAFNRPTTIYVTGSRHFEIGDRVVSNADRWLGGVVQGPIRGQMLRYAGVQQEWDVSVMAQLWAFDEAYKPVPVDIVVTQPAADGPPPGLVLIRPGHVTGSVYAPDSLVVLQERNPLARAWFGPAFRFGSLVGNEVVIRLGPQDHLTLGLAPGSRSGTSTEMLAWFDNPPNTDLTDPASESAQDDASAKTGTHATGKGRRTRSDAMGDFMSSVGREEPRGATAPKAPPASQTIAPPAAPARRPQRSRTEQRRRQYSIKGSIGEVIGGIQALTSGIQ